MLKSTIHSFLNDHAENFNGTVLVSRHGRILYQEAFGFANLEWSVPNTITTKFRIGSVTKSITALGILMLSEEKRIRLSDNVDQYIPGFAERTREITLTHLLNHTSGIGNITMQPDFALKSLASHSVDDLVEWIFSLPAESKPGEKFSYSNSGYILLGKIIESVSGLSFAEFLDKKIFSPAGMQNSTLDSNAILLNKASGYEVTPVGDLQNASYIDMSNAYSAGGIVSTAEDLHLLNSALDSGKLLSGEMLNQLFAVEPDPYRYGWNISKTSSGQPIAFHHGGINGYTASFMKLLEQGAVVIVLSNVSTLLTSTLAGVIVDALEKANAEN
ncbi:serine hydrolase domain-containing protein [Paenibacillus azoreducens]|uniref:Beta-lactamase-related domain-containing protein n=1 Tax=Paenibacillus azoreducens TaxID=116718 RepID=A0A919YB41_9BACL|nr:serine hydrolase domain-containing protein [Paenibacillus azoreducens]GIO47159.1 hypothetical protein J34TS1_19240 [Paenibacillus azoreducens]